MTDDERRDLRVGDRVVYLDDSGRECRSTVRHAPSTLHSGEWVVWLAATCSRGWSAGMP